LHHFAVGDAVAWSGIKRVNNTKSMSQYCATNLAELILAAEDGVDPAFMAECPEFQPRMSLAIGDEAVVYRGGGDDHVKSGKELKHRIFGKSLGIEGKIIEAICDAGIQADFAEQKP
jgi:apoptosis-inducing factor 2